jgi:gamma-glutamylputrescine oxidase
MLTGEVHADVCVIGGGFTGLSCALELAQAGRKVILLEAERVGWGASGRNGGQCICGYSTDALAGPARQAGVTEKYLFDLTREAISLLHARRQQYSIDCDWRSGYLLAAIHARHCRELEEHANTLTNRYHYPLRLLDLPETRAAIASRRYCGAMVDEQSGHLHPLKYVLGLSNAALASGVRLHEQSPALSVVDMGNNIEVKTAAGMVCCRQVVFAGNAYLEIAPRLRTRVMPASTCIGATAPLGAAAAENLIANQRAVCDMNFVIDYFRCSADTRLLFGGRVDYANRTPSDLAGCIRQRMEKVFPQLIGEKLDYVWGGAVAITINRFPDIGRQGNNVYYAQGFSGHGVALSGFAGKILADAIVGDTEKLDVFSRIRHRPFPGGNTFRTPLLVLAMLYYQLRDLFG